MGQVFAICAMRSIYTLVSHAISDLPYLKPAVALVLGFVGGKMFGEYFHYDIGVGASLAVVSAPRVARTHVYVPFGVPVYLFLTRFPRSRTELPRQNVFFVARRGLGFLHIYFYTKYVCCARRYLDTMSGGCWGFYSGLRDQARRSCRSQPVV